MPSRLHRPVELAEAIVPPTSHRQDAAGLWIQSGHHVFPRIEHVLHAQFLRLLSPDDGINLKESGVIGIPFATHDLPVPGHVLALAFALRDPLHHGIQGRHDLRAGRECASGGFFGLTEQVVHKVGGIREAFLTQGDMHRTADRFVPFLFGQEPLSTKTPQDHISPLFGQSGSLDWRVGIGPLDHADQ